MQDAKYGYFGQETPYDQIACIASGAAGHASNMREGIGDPHRQMTRIEDALEKILYIYRTYVPHEWTETDRGGRCED